MGNVGGLALIAWGVAALVAWFLWAVDSCRHVCHCTSDICEYDCTCEDEL